MAFAKYKNSYQKTLTNSQPQTVNKHHKIVVQASTNDLLGCLVNYLSKNCRHLIQRNCLAIENISNNQHQLKCSLLPSLSSASDEQSKYTSIASKVDAGDIICWMRSPDRTLLTQGWQEIAFMNPVNVVFVYLLIKEGLVLSEMKSVHDLHRQIMSCLYLAFSYMGNEISYPLKPFLVEHDRKVYFKLNFFLLLQKTI